MSEDELRGGGAGVGGGGGLYDAHGDGGGAGASGVAEADFDPSDGGSASVGVGVGVGDVDDGGVGVGSGMEVDGESDGVFGNYAELMREQDCVLPMASVARIMKRSLPSNAKLAGDSKDTVQECASEFINFITSEATDKCIQEKRKTITGEDILWAMQSLGFDSYVEPLKLYLQRYRETLRGPSGGAASKDGDGSGGSAHSRHARQ